MPPTARAPRRLAAILLCAACHRDPTSAARGLPGTYTVATVNGLPLPQPIARSADRTVELTSGTLTLAPDARYEARFSYRVVANDGSVAQALTSSGSWARQGERVTLRPAEPGVLSTSEVRYAANALTFVDASGSVPVTIVFRR